MADKKDSLLITLHGIGTYGIWQRDFKNMVKEKSSSFEFYRMKYGRISPLRVAIPFFRKRIEKETMKYLEEIMNANQDKDVHIISHSFGTYLIVKYLMEHRAHENIKTLILSGSVLAPDYLNTMDMKKGIEGIKNIGVFINDCSISDKNLLMSKLFALNFSDGGRQGMLVPKNSVLHNRYFQGGHKVYFKKAFYEKYWLPHILDNAEIEAADERKRSVPLDVLEIFYRGLSKFKYILHALIFIPVVFYSVFMLSKKRHLDLESL